MSTCSAGAELEAPLSSAIGKNLTRFAGFFQHHHIAREIGAGLLTVDVDQVASSRCALIDCLSAWVFHRYGGDWFPRTTMVRHCATPSNSGGFGSVNERPASFISWGPPPRVGVRIFIFYYYQ